MNDGELREKVLDVLRRRRQSVIGEPFGMTAQQISEVVGDVSSQKVAQVLRGCPGVDHYTYSGRARWVLNDE